MATSFARYARVAAVLMAASLTGAAVPVSAQTPDDSFELGFALTALPRDSAGAKSWLAAQSTDIQRTIRAACDAYVKHPTRVEIAETVVFCVVLVGR